MKSDRELRQIAMDFVDGKIFTDRHLRPNEADLVSHVFMPLGLMDNEKMSVFLADKPRLIYEYLDSVSPRGLAVNGYPIFFSMRFLNEEETGVVMGYVEELSQQRCVFLGPPEE